MKRYFFVGLGLIIVAVLLNIPNCSKQKEEQKKTMFDQHKSEVPLVLTAIGM